ncbi:hypothetical protein PIB30_069272 [Stylosanthes scabra]|uniref:Uncharacterized protein n=1 Tax=Stylosanthes scabra TaxID=79078 RepID=A0ABU6VMM3_9FABA|nr:hypothetical protein [Stylosanthes scabra]
MYLELPLELKTSRDLDLIGAENGIVHCTYATNDGAKSIIAWNMTTKITSDGYEVPDFITQNMRLQAHGQNNSADDYKQFAKWVLELGDVRAASSGNRNNLVTIPQELLIVFLSFLVEAIYSDYLRNDRNTIFLQD